MNRYYQAGLVPVRRVTIGALGGSSGLANSGIGANIPEEVDSINQEMNSLNSQLFSQLPATTDNAKFKFYSSVWNPFYQEWRELGQSLVAVSPANIIRSQSFVLQRGVFKDLQEKRDRLRQMWNGAEESGFSLQGPPPTRSKRDPLERGEDFLSSLWSLLKTLVWVVIAGGLAWLGFTAIRELRS